ncbi:hypothetical protein KK062_11025 [Fulvivirgaceae bacterium PWU5]|uniref:Fibronectin type-III domain-containing protein n=1 Tax=Dawidia cretensis TaxID=2782350 RepID=A0AAP2GPL8_9BACT|nr:FISUMP domain-containing protein [Dawidia cretensis]MBT1708761.1 hypothetical protein [Dawidia cretensis]
MRHIVVLLILMVSGIISGFSNTIPSRPELKLPANQQQDYTDGLFSWTFSSSSNGTAILYDLYVGSNPASINLFQDGIYDGFENNKVIVFSDGVDISVILLNPLPGGTTFYWKVVARDDQGRSESAAWSFATPDTNLNAPTNPTNPTPTAGAANAPWTPLLGWDESTDLDGDAVSYSLYLDSLTNPSKLLAGNLSGTNFKINTPLKGNKTYYWKVVSGDGRGKESQSSIWSFKTANNLPLPPVALFPANNSTGIEPNVELLWTRSFDADNDVDHYELWYGTSSQVTQMHVTTLSNSFLYLNAGTKYYWKVAVVDKQGGRTESDTWTFTTKAAEGNEAPAIPLITAPLNNAGGVGLPPTLVWAPSVDPDNDPVFYDVYFGTSATTLQRVGSGLSTPEFVPTGTSPAIKYYWKITATDRKGGTSQSSVSAFTTTSADVNITGLSVYYRYSHLQQLYEYAATNLSPAFNKSIETYEVKGKTTMTGFVALVLNHTGSVDVDVELPSYLTLSTSSPYIFGLPTNASTIYFVSGNFSAHNQVTVRVTSGSVTRSYSIDLQINQLPDKPILLSPANLSDNVGLQPTFGWQGGEDPDGTRTLYRVYVGTSATNMLLGGTAVNTSTFTYGQSLLSNTKYYWKVVAQDVTSESTESDIYSFVTEKDITGTVPVLTYPRTVSTYMDIDFDMLWRYDPSKNASFDVYLDTQSPPVRVAEHITDMKYAVHNLPYSTTYYWKIVAHNADGTTAESTVQNFRTKPRQGNPTGSFVDTRDGQTYQWVLLGDRKWMIHNLAYQPDPGDGYSGYSYVFDESTGGKEYFVLGHDPENLRKYGYLYNWSGALNAVDNPVITVPKQGVCPAGWAIPTSEQWADINPLLGGASGSDAVVASTIFYDTWSAASGKESSWLNVSGLSILPSGMKIGGSIFEDTNAAFWLANMEAGKGSYIRYSYTPAKTIITIGSDPILQGAVSVRCVKDNNRAPVKPLLQSPLDRSVDQPFTTRLEWQAVTDSDGEAVTYTLYVDTSTTPVQKVATGITGTFFQVKALKQNTTYYWKVVASDTHGTVSESDVWRFTTLPNAANASPRVPTLTQPANNATAVSRLPVLRWNALSDSNGDPVFARVYIGTSASDLTIVAEDITSNQYTVTTKLISSTEYYWQIVAYDNKGGVTPSAVYKFITGNAAPPKPELLTPANNTNGTLRNHMLTWKPAVDPDGDNVTYTVYTGLSADALSAQAVAIRENYYSFGFADTPVGTDFYWKVVASDAKGLQTSSDTWRFRTYAVDGGINTGITLVSPTDRATNVELYPTLSWNAFVQNAKYDVYLQQGTSTWVLTASDVTATSFTVSNFLGESGLLPHTSYNWQIVYKDGSGKIFASPLRTFTTRNLLPVKPVLTAPTNQATQQPYTLTFAWQSTSDPDGDKLVYDFYLGTGANPTQKIAENLMQTQFSTPLYSVLPGTQYYWKVVAKDQYSGATSSDVWSFTVQNAPQNEAPSAPGLQLPANYAQHGDTHPVLSWEAGKDLNNDPLLYDVYLDISSDLKSPVATGLNVLTYNAINLLPHTTYYWKVVARDGHGGEAASAVWSFKTPNRAPNVVTLIAPSDEEELTVSSTVLAWNTALDPDNDVVTYDVYLDESINPSTRIAESLTTPSYPTPTLSNNKTYYWKVVTKDVFGGATSSVVHRFYSANEDPTIPVLLSPVRDGAIGVQSVNLSWSSSADPEGGVVAYDVYLDNNAAPQKKIGTVYSGTTILTTPLALNTPYYWKVVAIDKYGGAAESETWRITYQPGSTNQPPVSPVLTYPQHQSTLSGRDVTLRWQNSTDPEGDDVLYDIYLSGPLGTETQLATNWPYTHYSLYNLEFGKTFSWRVVAKDNTGNRSSMVWTFTTPGGRYYTVSGKVRHIQGNALQGALLQGFPTAVYTDATGVYAGQVPAGWEGTITPVLSPYQFSPAGIHVAAVQMDLTDQNFIASEEPLYSVAGTVTDTRNRPVANVALLGFPGAVSTNGAGQYTAAVPQGWSGTVSPVLADYTFAPSQRAYAGVGENFLLEDYQAVYTGSYTISGTVKNEIGQPLSGIVLKTEQDETQTDIAGNYAFHISPGWSGTVMPVSDKYTFNPANKTYSDVWENQPEQNYTSAVVTGTEGELAQAGYIYPNPTSDLIQIELAKPLKTPGMLVIYTASGQEAARCTLVAGTKTIRWQVIDASGKHLNTGLYYCCVFDTNKNRIMQGKVMVMDQN